MKPIDHCLPALRRFTSCLLLAGTALSLQAAPASLKVQVDQPGHRISPLLWGIFFEDINMSTDGGIYPERVRNRSFEDSEQPDHWKLVKPADSASQIRIDTATPLNPLNRRSLQVKLDGSVSLVNTGYYGMSFVQGQTYVVRVSARAGDGFQGPVDVVLSAGGSEAAKGRIEKLTGRWAPYTLTLTSGATDLQGSLKVEAHGKGTLWLDMVSLMPESTWKDHGLRPDLAKMLDALKPAFLRFPGGCWVEGENMEHMYNWKKTVGDIALREPLWNIWQYWATHGLGHHEYLQMAEDLGAEPLFCINVGMSHREVVPMDRMGQWIQDALDAIEYANGPTNTVWGGLRARNGHPAPFNMKYLEIGNENGGPAYHERWALFCAAIKAKHPEIHLIANVWGGYPTNIMPEIIDEHYYHPPDWFIQHADQYDNYDRKGPKVFVGEYAVTSGAGLGNLRGAIGEAAFMTGMERNSDVVVMAAYAPLLVNVNHKRWPINLINFDSARAFGLPSYYVQQLFSVHRGDYTLPIDLQSPKTHSGNSGGAIGVGTWLTEAEYKEIKVTRGNETLFTSDFADGTKGFKLLGGGDWKVADGALRQTRRGENIRAIAGDKSWTDYTLTLKARKIAGEEGFLILFRVRDDNGKAWWNLGGWGNRQHGIELGGIVSQKPGRIETGRWYDIRIENTADRIRCYLDGQLVHDVPAPTMRALHASASKGSKVGEVILKVVNSAAEPLATDIQLGGVQQIQSGRLIELTSENATDENTLEQPTKVAPVERAFTPSAPRWTQTFPGNSLTILRLNTR